MECPTLSASSQKNCSVYGLRKVWRQLPREDYDLARGTVARRMRGMGLRGVIRDKPVRTIISDKAALGPLHLGGLVHYRDRGSQYVSIHATERLAQAGIAPSVGSVGGS